MGTLTKSSDSRVPSTRQWGDNPTRELGTDAHLIIPILLDEMGHAVSITLLHDRCNMGFVVLTTPIELLRRVLLKSPADRQRDD